MNLRLKIILCVLLSAFSSVYCDAQEIVRTKKVIIGVKEAPPFVQLVNGQFVGLSIDSWKMVNENLNWEYEFKQYNSMPELLNAVKNKEVDFSISPISVTKERALHYSFTQPYYISNTVMARKNESAVWNVVTNLMTWQFISAVGVLFSVIFIFGFLIWIFERKKNKEQFGVGKLRGLGQGFWWSAVTMTTVGYGDKAPKTTMGRIIGIIWMFIAVVTISSLTAGIASALTVQNLKNEIASIEDLNRFKVETVEHSSSENLLKSYNVTYQGVLSIEQGLENLKQGESQIFIYDEPLILYEINKSKLAKDITILPNILNTDYYAYCFPKDSKLEKEIDPLLIKSIKSMEWMTLVKKYKK